MNSSKLVANIGLEVHIRLNTKTKVFSQAKNYDPNLLPNLGISLYDIGIPGTLPLINKQVLIKAYKLSQILNGKFCNYSQFSRKHYIYPDMSKGYQITQNFIPIIQNGYLEIDGTRIDINGHIEEDAGKLTYEGLKTKVNFNRAGYPLVELVTQPTFDSASKVILFLKTLRYLIINHDISSGSLETGAFKSDINISVRYQENQTLGNKCEIKNLNSFELIEKAINYEIMRQSHMLTNQQNVISQTLSINELTGHTKGMRPKEQSIDYLHITDPDLPVITLTPDDLKLHLIAKNALTNINKLSVTDYQFMINHPNLGLIFDRICQEGYSVNDAFKITYTVGSKLDLVNSNTLENFIYLLGYYKKGLISSEKYQEILPKTNQESLKVKEYIAQAVNVNPFSINIDELINTVKSEQPDLFMKLTTKDPKFIHVVVGEILKYLTKVYGSKFDRAKLAQELFKKITQDNHNL